MTLPVPVRFSPAKGAGLLFGSLVLIIGCANPGPPRSPSLHLVEVVSDLSAERVGGEVHLRWTTPAKTTDGLATKGILTAELCRSTISPGSKSAPPCSPIRRLGVKPGASETVDILPSVLTVDPQALIAYQISIHNDRERSAGLSLPAFAITGTAPPTVADLRAQATEQGALLRWKPEDAVDSIELERVHDAATAGPRPAAKQPFQPAGKEEADVRFRVARTSSVDAPFRPDAGGTLDATAHRGETYVYTAQRVRKVTLGGHTLEIRSALSSTAKIVMRDSFPPKAPTGLEEIATEHDGVFTIDLSWRPGAEPDLAGYLLYRQELDAKGGALGPAVRLNSTPVTGPGYQDSAVLSGHTYRYAVTAIDMVGNESAKSATVLEGHQP